MNAPHAYLGFEGPIAAGKTTLATRMAAHLGCELALEEFEGNVFLPDFYRDRDRWALPMQLWFLAERHKAMLDVPERRSRARLIADYTYQKDAVFARVLLPKREFDLYEKIRVGLHATLDPPNLIVYLDAPNNVLLQRIKERGREYEATIDDKYLDGLRQAYEEHLLVGRGARVMRINTADINLSNDEQMGQLFESITRHVEQL